MGKFVLFLKKRYNNAMFNNENEGWILKQQVILETEFMTLGQMLKETTVIGSGGQAKWYLAENTVLVDGEPENRRGRKLYPGMMIEVPDVGTFFMVKKGKVNNEAE